MKINNILDKISSYSECDLIRFLLGVGYFLTIIARETYEPGSENIHAPSRLRSFNEIQHRIQGYSYKLISHDTSIYSLDVFLNMLCNMLKDADVDFEKMVKWIEDRERL